jgi:hypothetical protein
LSPAYFGRLPNHVQRDIRIQDIKDTINEKFAHLLQWQRDEMLKDIMDFKIDLSDIAPRRSFTGFSFEVETNLDSFDGQKFFLSLNDLALQKGDRIHYEYDFGDPSIFIAEIVNIEENQPLLPEIYSKYEGYAVRAIVVEESTIKLRPQYPVDDAYDSSNSSCNSYSESEIE